MDLLEVKINSKNRANYISVVLAFVTFFSLILLSFNIYIVISTSLFIWGFSYYQIWLLYLSRSEEEFDEMQRIMFPIQRKRNLVLIVALIVILMFASFTSIGLAQEFYREETNTSIDHIQWSPNGQYIATNDFDEGYSAINLWNDNGLSVEYYLPAILRGQILEMKWLDSNSVVGLTAYDVVIWDIQDQSEIFSTSVENGDSSYYCDFEFESRNLHLVTTEELTSYDISTGNVLWQIPLAHNFGFIERYQQNTIVYSYDVSNSIYTVMQVDNDGSIVISQEFDLQTDAVPREITIVNNYLAILYEDSTLDIVDLTSMELMIHKLIASYNLYNLIGYNSNLFIVGKDTVLEWSLPNLDLQSHTYLDQARALSLSPSSDGYFAVGKYNTIRFWNAGQNGYVPDYLYDFIQILQIIVPLIIMVISAKLTHNWWEKPKREIRKKFSLMKEYSTETT